MKPSRNVAIMSVLAAAAASTAALVSTATTTSPAPAMLSANAERTSMASQQDAANMLRQQVASSVKSARLGNCYEFEIGSIIAMPGTPREQIEKVERQMYEWLGEQSGGARFQPVDRWNSGSVGQPVAITYSFPDDGINVSNGTNSLHATLNGIFGSEPVWKAIFAEEFARWAQYTNVTYQEVSDDNANWNNSPGPLTGGSNRGDVRMVMGPIDGANGVLAFNFFPDNGDMQFDEDESWGQGATDRFFRNVITHEHGHGMGLAHTCPDDDDTIGGFPVLMKPFIDTGFLGPQFDDILSIQDLYGDFTEPNNSGGSSVNLPAMGLSNNGIPISIDGLSLHSTADFDLFRVENFGGTTVTVVVSPVGPSYFQGPQNGSGNSGCVNNSGGTFNGAEQGDIVVEILRNNFIPDLVVDAAGLGASEIVNAYEMGPDEETWYVRVTATGFSTAQMYDISVSTNGGGMMMNGADFTGDGCVDSTDLAVLLAAWGTPGADLTGDNNTDSTDLAVLLAAWTGAGC